MGCCLSRDLLLSLPSSGGEGSSGGCCEFCTDGISSSGGGISTSGGSRPGGGFIGTSGSLYGGIPSWLFVGPSIFGEGWSG